MALLNGMYIHVTNETVTRSVESVQHPVEKGFPLTSNVKKQPIGLSLSGSIVNTDKYDANTIRGKIQELMFSGSLITYSGRNAASNYQIQSFDSDHDNRIWGGLRFSMELVQVRIANSSYVVEEKPTSSPTPEKTVSVLKEQAKSTPKLEVGATVVFKGGSVYVSSDASKAASTRGRSTCKITNINTKSWAKHQYHLKSSDGGKVYGWVDKANIEGVPTTSTASTTISSTQQVSNGKGTAVYHTVKRGDTVYSLVTKKYKSLGKSVSWVIKNNPKCFSRAGDPKTLKVNSKLLMGYKK